MLHVDENLASCMMHRCLLPNRLMPALGRSSGTAMGLPSGATNTPAHRRNRHRRCSLQCSVPGYAVASSAVRQAVQHPGVSIRVVAALLRG